MNRTRSITIALFFPLVLVGTGGALGRRRCGVSRDGLRLATLTRYGLLVSIVFSLLSPGTALADSIQFGLGGIVYVASNAGGTDQHITPLTQVTSLSDYLEGTFTRGQEAIAAYSGNLATGTLGAYAYAASSATATAFARAIQVEMKDTLYFSVPAGIYVAGLSTTVSGSIAGSFVAFGDGATVGDFEVNYGSAGLVQKYSGETNRVVNLPFHLTTWIVKPGTTLAHDATVPIVFYMAIGGDGKFWASSPHLGDGNSATTDFGHTLSVSSLTTPAGYNWTSASGVFLSESPAVVPEPAALWLLATGFVVIAGLGRRLGRRL